MNTVNSINSLNEVLNNTIDTSYTTSNKIYVICQVIVLILTIILLYYYLKNTFKLPI